jgi:xanthine dehydrogenase accessory factor
VDPLTYTEIDALVRRHGRVVVCLVVRAQGSVPRKVGARMAVFPDGTTQGTVGGGLFESLVRADALAALAEEQSLVKKYDFRETGTTPEAFGAVCGGWAELFLEVVALPDQLLIVGGGHCGRALAGAAALLGNFEVTLLDDRSDFADDEGWPLGVSVIHAAPEFGDLSARVHARTFVVLVSRGAGTDEQALRQIIETDPAYIGMMGSRRKVRTVLDHLRAEGISAARLARVHAPIGLAIGAETPAEIAVSILAQIITVRSGAALGTGK